MNPRRAATMAAIAVVVLVGGASPAGALPIPGAGLITDAVGGATGFVWDKFEAGITRWVLATVGRVVEELAGFLGTAAEPDPAAVWFAGPGSPFASVRLIAGGLLGVFVLAGIIQGLLQGDPGGMLRRVALNLPMAVLAMLVVTEVTAHAIRVVDALAAGVLGPAGGQSAAFLVGFGRAAEHASGGFAAIAIALVAITAGLAMWVELIVRSSLVYLLVALSPLVFAAMVWPAARGAARRLVELLAAVVVAKLAIAIALAVGVAALAGAGSAAPTGSGVGDQTAVGLGTMLVGATILVLAAFAPFVVLRLIPVVETAVLAQGVSRAPLRSAHTTAGAALTLNSLTRLSAPTAAPLAATAPAVVAATTASRLCTPTTPPTPTATAAAAPTDAAPAREPR